jgi:PAS domain-containing protein
MSYTRSAPMQPPPRGLGTALLAAADRAGLGLLIWTEREQEQSIQYANVIAGDLLGRAPHELIGRALAMLVAPSDLPTLRAASGAFAEQGRTVQVRLLRPDHSHVTASIAVGHGHLGERPALVGLLFETARRHRAEQALRTSELLYRRVIDAAPEPIIIVGGGEIVYANAAALELSGFDRLEQMRAAGVPGTTDSRDLPWAVHDSQPISHAGVDSVVELRLRRAGGQCADRMGRRAGSPAHRS